MNLALAAARGTFAVPLQLPMPTRGRTGHHLREGCSGLLWRPRARVEEREAPGAISLDAQGLRLSENRQASRCSNRHRPRTEGDRADPAR